MRLSSIGSEGGSERRVTYHTGYGVRRSQNVVAKTDRSIFAGHTGVRGNEDRDDQSGGGWIDFDFVRPFLSLL